MYSSTFSEDCTSLQEVKGGRSTAPIRVAAALPRAEDFGIWPVPADVPSPVVTPSTGRLSVFADVLRLRSGVRGLPGPGGARGVVRGLSRPARRRLILRLAEVRTAGLLCHFVTLTYPDEALRDDWASWKRDIAVWRKRLLRAWPGLVVGGVWKLEPQPRRSRRQGAYVPHFHLLIWSSGELPDHFKKWLARSWYETVGSGLKKHLKRGTDYKLLDSRRAIRMYVSKYVAKESGDSWPDEAVGRCWGQFGDLPHDHYLDIEISRSEYLLIRRLARKWLKSRNSLRYARYLRKAEIGCDLIALGAESGIYMTVFRMLDAIRPGVGYVEFFIDMEERR